MSKKEDQVIVCPFCSYKSIYSCWGAVNVNLNPELKKLLLSSQLNVVQCINCNNTIKIESEIFYHDLDKQIMIELFPTKDVKDRIERFMLIQSRLDPKVLSNIKKGYILRYVWTMQQLIEKIKIFDANLNDRIIEIYKFWLNGIVSVARKENVKYDSIYFDKYDIEDDSMHFFFNKNQEINTIKINNKMYRDLLNVIGKDFIEDDEWNIVDEEYGKITLLEKVKNLKQNIDYSK